MRFNIVREELTREPILLNAITSPKIGSTYSYTVASKGKCNVLI